ncbi:HAMP domain-containing protein [Luteimonas viscosa]|uniref:HAMP domain-containing protein n=1 Tax=Luteimonas viscosa TaxID=1132694 RepID=A0A5D4XP26_9GAMM|nr:methyl-accepting chemotaxis protein [Luteimonas viscosa]TYT26339.1 HAMP domain-containing protein [Luteimonas viscosa]
MKSKNLTISNQLAIGFGAVVLIMLVIGGISLHSQSEMNTAREISEHTFKVLATGETMQANALNIETGTRGYLLSGDKAHLKPFIEGQTGFERSYADAKQLTADNAKQQARLVDLDKAYRQLLAAEQEAIAGREAATSTQDVVPLFQQGRDRAAMGEIRSLLGDFANEETALLATRSAALNAARARGKWSVLIGSLIAVLVAVGMGLMIRRQLVKRMGLAIHVADAIASGKLDNTIDTQSRDETGRLLISMNKMQEQLQRFASAQQTMQAEHDAGDIEHRIDAAAFPGAYGQMAEQTNNLAASHIAMNARVIEIVGAYASGDLSSDMDRLPGKKAEITAAVDAVKIGTLAVNAEIKRLVDAAVAGDFSQRGDAQRYQFVYRDMLEGLNTLMTSADHGLDEIGSLLAAVADGDLGQRITVSLPGQFSRVADDANRTVDRLADIVGQIRSGSDAINSAASEIAAGNDDLSRRTEQQAASLEETASSMEELTSTVRQNADNARQANQLAIGAVDVASQGGEVVGKVVQTMSAISDSSSRIADIIGVIDGIAFQTNILALNAAVEAARAGEQGRGFAVVAAEVRSLAQRSAGAAKEIKQLITDSTDKVRHGNELVDQAGRTMGEIVTSVKRVTDIIADISAASQEQSAGIEQVNQAITQMDESTQQNAALVEEATAAARSMEQQAGQLVQTIAVFSAQGASRIAPTKGRGISPAAAGQARVARHAVAEAPSAKAEALA